jgi:hypothetical protein
MKPNENCCFAAPRPAYFSAGLYTDLTEPPHRPQTFRYLAMPLQATLRTLTCRLLFALTCLAGSVATLAQTPASLSFQQPVCTQSVSGSVTLNTPAPAAGQAVQLASNMPAVISVAPSVTVPPGANSAAITLRCTPGTQSVAVSISATANSVSQTAVINVPSAALEQVALKPEQALPLPPTSFVGSVALVGPAPAGGVIVTLSNSHPALLNSPTSVTVASGAKSANFNVAVLSPVSQRTPFTITATGLGVTKTGTGTLTPAEPMSLILQPGNATNLAGAGGALFTARLTLNGPAGGGGLTLGLSSSNTSVATVPSTVTVRQGETSAEFTVTTSATPQSASAVITAVGTTVSKTANLTVASAQLSTLSKQVSQVIGGQTAAFTLLATSKAGAGGLLVNLSSSNPSALTVPASVLIPANASTAAFSASTASVAAQTNVTLTATDGKVTRTEQLLLMPEGLTGFDLSPTSVTGGGTISGRLTAFAGHNGFSVVTTSDQPQVAAVPAKVSVPANQTSQGFSITTTPVSVPTTVRLSAQLVASTKVSRVGVLGTGATSPTLSTSLTVNPPTIRSLSLSNTTVAASSPFTGTITLTGPAPAGLSVTVTSANKAVVVQSPVTFNAGASTASFQARTLPGPTLLVPITAKIGNVGTGTTATVRVFGL